MINDVKSLISRDESAALKGLLLLLIILGHNGLLNYNLESGDLLAHRRYLYLFHVTSFFILPFLYGYRYKEGNSHAENIKSDIIKNFNRLIVPYLWGCGLFIVILLIKKGSQVDYIGLIKATIIGSQNLHSHFFGEHFLWFLPSMFAVSIIKSLYFNTSRIAQKSIILFSCILWFLSVCKLDEIFDFFSLLPFSLSYGFYYSLIGLVGREMIKKDLTKISTIVVIGVTIVFTYLYCNSWPSYDISFNVLLQLILTPTMFLLLFKLREIIKQSKLLKLVGQHSIYIYMIHCIMYAIINPLILKLHIQVYLSGVISYIIVLALSIIISVKLSKNRMVSRFIFPQI